MESPAPGLSASTEACGVERWRRVVKKGQWRRVCCTVCRRTVGRAFSFQPHFSPSLTPRAAAEDLQQLLSYTLSRHLQPIHQELGRSGIQQDHENLVVRSQCHVPCPPPPPFSPLRSASDIAQVNPIETPYTHCRNYGDVCVLKRALAQDQRGPVWNFVSRRNRKHPVIRLALS